MVGEASMTSGIAFRRSTTLGHWLIEMIRWLGRWMAASSNSPDRSRKGRAT